MHQTSRHYLHVLRLSINNSQVKHNVNHTLDVLLNGLVDFIYESLELMPLLHGQHDPLLCRLQFTTGIVEFPYVHVPLAFEFRQLNEALISQVPRIILVVYLRLLRWSSLKCKTAWKVRLCSRRLVETYIVGSGIWIGAWLFLGFFISRHFCDWWVKMCDHLNRKNVIAWSPIQQMSTFWVVTVMVTKKLNVGQRQNFKYPNERLPRIQL